MQAIIRSEFSHCTIITIAHRLDSLLDFDTVAVMEKGELIEIGNPRALLSSKETTFSKLYNSGTANVRSH
jgi:ATP-binding cassette, subfamily C (CFTR/MRP), member 1